MPTLHVQFISIAKLSTDKSNYLNCEKEITNVLTSCNMTIQKLTPLKEDSKDGSKPTLIHKVIDVECECNEKEMSEFWMYGVLRRKWSTVNVNLFRYSGPEMIPWLTFTEKNAFSNKRNSYHQVKLISKLYLGTLVWPSLLISHFKFLDGPPKNCEANFYHDVKDMEFILGDYKLEIQYSSIRHIIVKDVATESTMFLELESPPLVFSKIQIAANRKCAWKRIVTYPGLAKHTLGSSSVLAVTLANTKFCWEIASRMHFRCAKIPVYCVNMTVTDEPLRKIPKIDVQHFGCLYLIVGLMVRNYRISYQYDDCRTFIQEMTHLANIDGNVLEKVLTDILYSTDRGLIFNCQQTILRLFEWHRENSTNVLNNNHYFLPEKTLMIRRLTITPTRTLFWPAEPMFENRILRNFDPEYAVRVLFRDDNQMKLNHSIYIDDAVYKSAIEEITRKGIKLGNRYFEFLAWSNSQIRDHAVWFYAKDEKGNTVETIRSWMGDFSGIRSVSKFMSRMGQCFSHTTDTISVPMNKRHIIIENDVKGGKNPISGEAYCFTDGIGKISTSAAIKMERDFAKGRKHPSRFLDGLFFPDGIGNILAVCSKLRLSKLHSAYQIRYAGYKGVLCLDQNLNDVDIVFRKSMQKFDCPNINKLEIVQVSLPMSLQLNRPLICILEHLGVSGSTFIQMQRYMLQELTDMLLEENKAVEYLNTKTPHNLINFKELGECGIRMTVEPFFRSLLLFLHRRAVVKIRKKAQLAIDPSEGRNMLGVLDETGTLKYGQIFVQYTIDIFGARTNGKTKILKGKVLVTKNPCLQPGDVRLLEAVDVPQLHHIFDCIVFPKRGERPHPNEMAGSDLDGDEYTVLWKRELVSPIKKNHPPMNFPLPNSQLILDKITKDDMIDCLVNYIKNDTLGMIGTAHLAMADQKGLNSPECMELATKFSLAVDFVKSGQPTSLSPTERPLAYPDFMEKGNKVETYKSRKVLGKLYRMCKEFEKVNELASYSYHDVEIDRDLVYPGWEEYYEAAVRSRNNYNTILGTIFQRYGIQHECEALSGAFAHLEDNKRERNERANIEKMVSSIIQTIGIATRNEFLREFINDDVVNDKEILKLIKHEAIFKKASAWYVVTYREKDPSYLSFPWTVSRYLGLLKLSSASKRRILTVERPIFTKWDNILKHMSHLKLPDVPGIIIDELVKEYYFIAPARTMQIALAAIYHWAVRMNLLKTLKNRQSCRTFISFDKLMKIFFHAAYVGGYIGKHGHQPIRQMRGEKQSPSCLWFFFFKYCMFLGSKRKDLPLGLRIPKDLAKCATYTYHNLAVTTSLDVLGLLSNNEFQKYRIQVEMEPQRLPRSLVASDITDESRILFIKKCLMKWTGVNDVQIRLNDDSYALVSATGTLLSVRMLQRLLSKDVYWLSMAFTVGRLPEDITPWK